MSTKDRAKKLNVRYWCGSTLAFLLIFNGGALLAQNNQADANVQFLPEPEVLEEGPVHEAFAEPLSLELRDLEVVPKLPPEPIQELPPEERPEGDNMEFLPGYWTWMPEKEDFAWVSGFWRNVPPDREWVPGHWQEVEGGYAWVSGFWSDQPLEQVQYLPEPPASLESGPSSPAPGDNHLWAPGCWQWHNTGYAWQPGYWYQANPNWIWVPAHHRYTPLGWVHVGGYWDYPLYRRGLLYAPVWWGAGFHPVGGWGAHWWWRPRAVINVNFLWGNLWVHPGFNRFWYGPRWHGHVHRGFHRWGHQYDRWGRGPHVHDPLWAHSQWNERRGRAPDGRSRDAWDREVGRSVDRARSSVVTNIDDLRQRQGSSFRTRTVDQTELDSYRDRAQRYRDASSRRATADLTAIAEGRDRSVGRIVREGDGTSTWTGARSQGQRDGIDRARAPGATGRSDIRSRAEADAGIRRGAGDSARTDFRSRADGSARGDVTTRTDIRGRADATGRTDIRGRTEAPQRRAADGAAGRDPGAASRLQQGAVDRGGQFRRSAEAGTMPRAEQRVLRQEVPSARQAAPSPTRGSEALRQRSMGDQPGRSVSPRPSDGRAPGIQRSAPSIQRSAPSVQRSAPSVQRSSPSIQRSSPSVGRSSPAIRSTPSIGGGAPTRSAPAMRSAPSTRSAPAMRGGGGSSRSSSPAMRGGGSSRSGGGAAMRSGGGSTRGGGAAMRSGGGGGRGGGSAMRSGGGAPGGSGRSGGGGGGGRGRGR